MDEEDAEVFFNGSVYDSKIATWNGTTGRCAEYPLIMCDWGWVEINGTKIVAVGNALCD